MSFDKFYFRNFGCHLFQRYFRSNIAISKTSFWVRPLKIEHAKRIVWLVLKKTLSCVWCHASDRVCFTENTQMTSFSFQLLVRRGSLFLIFLDSSSLFLLDWSGTHLFGRALTRSHKLLFLPMTTFLDAFLKKRMAPPSWKPEGIAKCRLEICNWLVRN